MWKKKEQKIEEKITINNNTNVTDKYMYVCELIQSNPIQFNDKTDNA